MVKIDTSPIEMLAQASRREIGARRRTAARRPRRCSSLRAAVHSMISSSRKNGIGEQHRVAHLRRQYVRANSPRRHLRGKSTIAEKSGPLQEAQDVVAPGAAHVGVEVVDHRVLLVDDQRGAVVGTVGPPDRFACRTRGVRRVPRSSSSACAAAARPPRRSCGRPVRTSGPCAPATEIAPHERQFGGVGGVQAQQPQHRGGEVEAVQVAPVRRRGGRRRTRSTASGSRGRWPPPCPWILPRPR